jgi:uncharacterized protein
MAPFFSRRSRASIFFLLALILFLSACKKKSLSTNQLRAVTHEFVAAAQRVTGHRSEIAIRPALAPGGAIATDHIYITLADPAQKATLEQALDSVARRHDLERSRVTSSTGATRFDYSSGGRRTHALHIISPVAERPPLKAQAGAGPRLAIILDDLGYDRSSADALLALPFPITVSVLPHHPFSTEVAEEAHRRGDQVMLHLPMASTNDGAQPEAVELHPGMSAEEVSRVVTEMLETVPHAVGVNNHQGSLASADPQLMGVLMPALRQRGLFFIDSRTTTETVAYDVAEHAGVRAAFRRVFLDDTPTREAVLAQLALAAKDAEKQGWAIAIGHPHPATLAALEEGLPRLEARGIRFVFASDLAR